jgi:hypothetical protein
LSQKSAHRCGKLARGQVFLQTLKAVKREQEMGFPSTKERNLEKGKQPASFPQSPGSQMQKMEAGVMIAS